jgi:hypothetical protein
MIGDNQSADRNLNIKAPPEHVKKTAPENCGDPA